MGIFATRDRRAARAEVARGSGATENAWGGLPSGLAPRFEVVAEHLAAGRDMSVACTEVGHELARDGADLGEALDGLRTVWARVRGGDPEFTAVRALCTAWGEETLGFVHQLSCEDPLTGLATRAHLRARMSEACRGAEQRDTSAATSHALVVVDFPPLAVASAQDPFGAALWQVKLAETMRLVFHGEEPIAQVSPTRLVALVERGDLLVRRVGLLRDLVEDLGPVSGRARTWIEGMPSTDDGAAWLLDEIARG